jgi:hypothetical protein
VLSWQSRNVTCLLRHFTARQLRKTPDLCTPPLSLALVAKPLGISATMADEQRETGSPSPSRTKTDRQERESPRSGDRRRSRSPRRDSGRHEGRPRRKDAGFKWKEKRRDNDENSRRDRDSGLHRGYREHYRPRSRFRSPPPHRRSPRRDDRDRDGDRDKRRHRDDSEVREEKKENRERKEKRTAPAAPTQPMIIVYVNDRLGTKKAVPCFATDPISECYSTNRALTRDADRKQRTSK